MFLEKTTQGIAYEWGLAGPNGAWFKLYPEKETYTTEDVHNAKTELRMERDVVSLTLEWKSKKWFEEQKIHWL